ncbi:MAG: hemerythrin domain-containing protein [Elusimicrobiota bacterium]|nr:MAG: hemerythrin domain-containing protein [Elusimicrobiota bacterium]
MKDLLDSLLEEHAELRSSLAEMEELLGKAQGVGWDDQTDVDLPQLKEAEMRFSAMLKAHERTEEERLSDLLRRLALEGNSPGQAVETGHAAVRGIFRLLQTVTGLYDGQHVYALRTLMSKVAEELEHHLAYEEQELFPRLRSLRS